MTEKPKETLAEFVDRRSREILKTNLNRETLQKIIDAAGMKLDVTGITDEEMMKFFETPHGYGLMAQGLSNCRLEALIEYLNEKLPP